MACNFLSEIPSSKIGVAEALQNELEIIASKPVDKHVYKVDSFDAINLIRKSLLKDICEEGKKNRKKSEFISLGLNSDPELELFCFSSKTKIVPNSYLLVS